MIQVQLKALTWMIALPLAAALVPPAALAAHGQPRAEEPMPRLVRTLPEPSPPLFMAMEDALRADGSVRREELDPSVANVLNEMLSRASVEQGCVRLFGGFLDFQNPPEYESLMEAKRLSVVSFEGAITGIAIGIDPSGIPATLVRVRISEIFKNSGEDFGKELLAILPVAIFEARGRRFCRLDEGFDRMPQIGQGILAVLHIKPRDGMFGIYAPDEVIFLDKQDVPVFNGKFKSRYASTQPSLEEIRSVLRQKFEKDGGAR